MSLHRDPVLLQGSGGVFLLRTASCGRSKKPKSLPHNNKRVPIGVKAKSVVNFKIRALKAKGDFKGVKAWKQVHRALESRENILPRKL